MFTEEELQKEARTIIKAVDQLTLTLQQISNRLLKKINPDKRVVYIEPGGRVWYLAAGGSLKIEER